MGSKYHHSITKTGILVVLVMAACVVRRAFQVRLVLDESRGGALSRDWQFYG